jgi:hypothetical protein
MPRGNPVAAAAMSEQDIASDEFVKKNLLVAELILAAARRPTLSFFGRWFCARPINAVRAAKRNRAAGTRGLGAAVETVRAKPQRCAGPAPRLYARQSLRHSLDKQAYSVRSL